MKGRRFHKKNMAIYGVLLLFSLVFASFRGGVLPYGLFYFFLGYPLFLAVYIVYAHTALLVFHELPERRVKKMEEVKYRLVTENHGPLPLFRIGLTFEEELCLMKGTKAWISLLPGQRMELNCALRCRYAGTYGVGLKYFEIEDPLGLLSVSFPMPTEYLAIVRPRISDEAGAFPELKNRIPDHSRQKDLYEDVLGCDLRTYVPGDPLHAIHWKNYARTKEVLVRLPEEENLGRIHILLRTREKLLNLPEMKRRDLYLEYVISLAHNFLKQGKPVDFSYAAGDLKTVIITGWKEFEEFWHHMPEEITHHRSASFAKDMEQKIRNFSASGEDWMEIDEENFMPEEML